MKICRIISAYSPYSFGGSDIYAEKISRETVKRGNLTVVITINPFKGDTYNEDEGTKIYRFHPFNVSTVHSIGKKSVLHQGIWTLLDIYNYYSYAKIINILKQEKPDIVHLYTQADHTLSAFHAVKFLGLPLVYTIDDYILFCRRVVLLHANGGICTEKNISPVCRLYRQFSKDIVNKCVDLVISPSEFALNLHKKNGFFSNTEARVLPHGIELDNDESGNKKSQANSKKQTLDILYTGGLTRHKGIHTLIEAFRMIKNPDVRLHIVGGGVYEKELKRLAGRDFRIIFHGRFKNKEMREFYRNSDLLVVPSIWFEVMGNVIHEAFREGVPVIGANIGGIPEMVIENQTGYLFKPGDALDLKRVLESAIDNLQRLEILSKNCLEFVKQFEMDKYLDRLIGFYGEAIEINKKNRRGLSLANKGLKA